MVINGSQPPVLRGVVIADAEYLQNHSLYGQLVLVFRYGREDEEVRTRGEREDRRREDKGSERTGEEREDRGGRGLCERCPNQKNVKKVQKRYKKPYLKRCVTKQS